MSPTAAYSIGTPGTQWGVAERAAWFEQQSIKRSYLAEVATKLKSLEGDFDVEQYGALSYTPDRYPLFVVKTRNWDSTKPTVLVTGGVHGYESSGVRGAIRFVETRAQSYSEYFNVVVAPCVSPWGYETINRWNPYAVDPNRSFYPDSVAEESAALMTYVASLGEALLAHIDLHETTDTDNSEFRPALAARDAVVHDNWDIPDGFYTVGDAQNPQADFQTAIIKSVELVTHIAPADKNDMLIGEALQQSGVINYEAKALGLCMGVSNAAYVSTTEVYPDSPKVDDENCIIAQVAAITGGLDYIIGAESM